MDAQVTIDDERPTGNTHHFDFGKQSVRVVIGDDGAPIWVASDVCKALNISRTDSALRRIPEEEKGTQTLSTPGGRQEMSVITEPGLYRLIFRSRKDEAEKFQRWVFHEVLPEIRRTGRYAPGTPPDAVAENHEHRLTRVERKVDALDEGGSRDPMFLACRVVIHLFATLREQYEASLVDELQAHWRRSMVEANIDRDHKMQLLRILPLLTGQQLTELPADGPEAVELLEAAS